MSGYRVLLVEDEPGILAGNKTALEGAGYTVDTAGTVTEARRRIGDATPDLVVMDILLPDGSGIELCRELRERFVAPILFLTSMDDTDEIVAGLRAGGDDYITKPYRIEELLARIEAQLRRTERLRKNADEELGPLLLHTATQRAYLDGVDLLLSPKEFQILAVLMQHRGEYRTAGDIFAAVWGMDPNRDVRTVRVHISHLRSKIRRMAEEQAAVAVEYRDQKGYRIVLR